MPKKTRSYRAWQLQKLADPVIAASYLNACLEESPEIYLVALKKVAQANQMAKVAKDAGIQRETLYRSLSEQGNPTFDTLRGVYDAVGLRLITVAKQEKAVGPFGTSVLTHHATAHYTYPKQWGSVNYLVSGACCFQSNYFFFVPSANFLTNLAPSLGTMTGNSPPIAAPTQVLQYWNEINPQRIAI